ncbi:MAG: hypothetical protein OER90_17730 [Gemmatimonadota bacterium]|nr:hypothetical protein [Gemmatimonadota bacterium]
MKSASAFISALSAATLAACSASGAGTMAAAPTPAPFDPVGTFSFTTTYEGQAMGGRIVIRGEPGAYTGMVEPQAGGPPPVEIYAVTVEGQKVTVFADAGGEDLIMEMEFVGDRYTGSWTLGFQGGESTGERISP